MAVTKWSKQRVVEAIRECHRQGLPLSRVWRDDKPLFRAAVNHFGNWQNALHATGLEFKPRRKWSKEQILGDLRVRYCQGQSNIRHVDPGLADAAARYFGSLENAWEAANLDPPANRWTKRRIIEAIQDCYVRRLPLENAGCRDRKLASAAKRHFGTWRAAVEAAGLLPRLPSPVVQREWSAGAVIEAIRALSPDGVVGAIWKVDTGLYSTAKKRFGSWRAALQAAGLQSAQRQWSPQLVIAEILARHKRGRTLSSAIFRDDCRLGGAALRYFGTWRNALQSAGIDPNQVMARTRENEKGNVA